MAFAAPFAMMAATTALGVGAGVVASSLMKPKTPQLPEIKMPEIPDPIPPPNAPLNPSQTAALQKARARGTAPTGNKDIMLTSRAFRDQEDPQGLVQRTTLLGR